MASPNLCDLFAHSLAAHPQNLAVDHPHGPLTYQHLDKASSHLAARLTASGVTNRSPVLLITAHSTLNIVAILAILKAGGCFVPIDRGTWSAETVRYVCSLVESPVIVNTTCEEFAVPDGGGSQEQEVLHIRTIPDGDGNELVEDAAISEEEIRIEPEDPACIIFTSGSTGGPKGVVIPHAALCLYATTSPLNLDIAPGDRFLHVLSVAFDAYACMLFSTLAGGGTVVPCLPEDVYTKAPSCTVMAATPSILSSLPTPSSDRLDTFANMHTIILGGETASPELLASWVDAGVRVLVGYGVTETTSTGCVHVVERDPSTGDINPFLIGGSMPECPIWLADEALCTVEDDCVDGEIVIAGAGLATGYYQDEAKTAKAFFLWRNQRVYRTGDYGRWVRGPAGDRVLEFRGRKDRTVKNRGFLVNLDKDVEEGLLRAGKSLGVKVVVAMATEEGIVAVITPASVDIGLLLARASQGMSAYCLPTRIQAVDQVPLSSNGKVQRRKVLEMLTTMESSQHHSSSTTVLAEKDLEGVDQPGDDRLETVLLVARGVLRYPAEKAFSGDESFVSIGGSSLSALKIVGLLRQRNLHITVRDFFSCRTLAEIAHQVSSKPCEEQVKSSIWITPRQEPATAQKLQDLRSQARSLLGLPEDYPFEAGPLTSLQLDLAMPTLLDACKSVNQVKLVYGGAHASMMERAWRAVWRAEAVFRTEINLAIGCGAQIIHSRPFRIPHLRIFNSRGGYEKATAEVSMDVGLGCRLEFFAIHPTASASARTPPDSNRRVSIPGGTEEMTVVLSTHHSLIDGVSLKIILDKVELTAQGRCLYTSMNLDHSPSWSSSINANLGLMDIQKRRDAEARSFFASYLKDVPEDSWTMETNLEMAKERAVKTISTQSSVSSDEVAALASQTCVSPACVYYTAWAMAIASLQERGRSSVVVVGAVFSNRACQPEFEDVIGPFMSTLPLVIKLAAEESVASCLKRTMDDLLAVGEFSWVRADQVGAGRRMGNLLAMQLPLPGDESNPPPLRVESSENSDFPLSLLIEANGRLRIMYDTAMFEEKAVRRLVDHFKHSVHSLLYGDRVGDCVKINRLHERVLQQAEDVRSDADEITVKKVLERSIDRFAENVALEDCRGTTLTYRELDRLTSIVAHHINETLPPDAGVVAIYGDGTTGWILGLLGILKTGRTFVPLDPKWPLDRRAAVCKTSGAAAILFPDASQLCEAPSGLSGLEMLAVDSLLAVATTKGGQKSLEERFPDMACDSDSDLVIVFTSGTTGTPKGIPIPNRAFLALQSNPEATMFAAPGRRIAQFMSPAFDYCNVEIFSALLHGATLVLRDPLDPYAHLSKVNTVTMTPSVLAVIDPKDFPNLEVIFATGEAVTAGLVDRFVTRSLFFNAYGPAECCICTSFTRMVPGDDITIGTAIDTARMYILDEDRNPAPDGVRGELYLAGAQVLREYINAPEQSIKHILPDPWHRGERMYRTGDYGMRARDGRITYLGRIDRQVKIRGFRVELAGVEHALMSGPRYEDITQCAAFAVNGTLAACLAFGTSPLAGCDLEKRIGQLKDRLGKQLLPSWVPQVMFSVQPFPKTANGKVDTRALEALYAERMALAASRKSESETLDHSSHDHDVEGKLAEEWRRILQLEKDVKLRDCDDFFSLGGHSVLIMLLSTRLASVFRVRVTARELLPRPSFGSQVQIIQQFIEREATSIGVSDMNFAVNGTNPGTSEEEKGATSLSVEDLTELEKQVWFQYQVATKVTAFNIANILHIRGKLDIDRLMEALDAALASDPVLRSNLVEGPHGPRRRLRSAPPTARLVKRLNTNAEVNHRFDLEHDELIRVHLVRDRQEVQSVPSAQLVIVTSHSISDLGTLHNLLKLTSTAYKSSGSPSSAMAIARHDRPRHLDSRRWKRRPSSAEQNFWRKYLAGHAYGDQGRSSTKVLQRPFPSSPLATFRGFSRTREFQGRLVARLTPLMKRLGVTHHQVGIAAAALLLHWLSGEEDIVLGAPNANRTTPLEREALGQFLDRLPIRVEIPSASASASAEQPEPEPEPADVTSILTRVRDSSRLALAHAIPFSSILEALNFPSGALHHPLFDCMVTFHLRSDRLEKWLLLPSCEISSTPMFANGAKFPLMMEWFELGPDRWSLHIEYDTGHMDPSTVDIIEDALETILDAMGEEECALSELRLRLADLELPPLLDSLDDSLVSRSPGSASPRSRSSGHALLVERMASTIQGEMAACLEISGGEKMPCSSSFFAAGADSTAVVALRHRMRKKLGFDVPMRAIFEAQSALKLAEFILGG